MSYLRQVMPQAALALLMDSDIPILKLSLSLNNLYSDIFTNSDLLSFEPTE